jgi:Lon protease-like protein
MARIDIAPKASLGSTTADPLRGNRRTVIIVVLAGLLLAGLGWWSTRTLEHNIQIHERDELQALLRASTRALVLWFESKEHAAEVAAGDAIVQQGMHELAALAADSPSALREAEAQERVDHRLDVLIAGTEFSDFRLVDARGRIPATPTARSV